MVKIKESFLEKKSGRKTTKYSRNFKPLKNRIQFVNIMEKHKNKEQGKTERMLSVLIIPFVIIATLNPVQAQADGSLNDLSNNQLIIEGEKHFKNIRQLTFSGENAEAYFSADGKRLILQGHDGSDLCDQIYILDIESGKMEMVSTGKGVTTCSYFQYPDDNKIVYASTHHFNPNCPAPPDFSKGYVWKLHPEFDIFRADPDGKNVEQLTTAPGYDAEATYAEDGSKIVYTSISSGDLEIWSMNPDGSSKKQLTSRLGYDGGPFFSHDGSKIVWRAFYPETEEEIADYKQLLIDSAIRPMALQVRVMNSDGSNPVQITNNEAANFAPFFFPDDERIVFCSNLENPKGRNFDLYAIDLDGTNLERITYFEGFDGFPMFSPDGKYFVFASNRNNAKQGDTNIFICEWQH
jgi:Tol biopolymer transport system component